jgi:DNA invertase Pin-like site-specific DNA recombinase
MIKAVIYCRVSTEEETQINALDRQIQELEDFVKSNSDMVLVDKYIDRGKSGTTTKNRNQYNRLYEDILTDKFDIVIVKDNSRLTRNILDFYLFIDRLTKNDKKLFFYLDNKYYVPDDMILNGIKALLASQYSQELSSKINNAHKKNQAQGIVVTNNTMWGYTQVDGKLVIKENEARIVKRIFEMYASGIGSRTIANTLTDEGIKNRNGGEFSHFVVLDIIANEKYKGTLVCNKTHKDFNTKKVVKNPKSEWIIHQNAIPAIVSAELWEAANSIRKTKYQAHDYDKNIPKKGEYLFSNKITCGKCGRYYFHKIFNKNGKQYVSWVCQTKAGRTKKNCDNNNVSERFLIDGLTSVITEFLQNKDEYINEIMAIIEKLELNKQDNPTESLKKEKDRLLKRKSNLLDSLGDGIITKADYIQKAGEISERLKKIELEIIEADKNSNSSDIKSRLETMYKELKNNISGEITPQTIEAFLDSIIVNGDKIEISLLGGYQKSMPLSRDYKCNTYCRRCYTNCDGGDAYNPS